MCDVQAHTTTKKTPHHYSTTRPSRRHTHTRHPHTTPRPPVTAKYSRLYIRPDCGLALLLLAYRHASFERGHQLAGFVVELKPASSSKSTATYSTPGFWCHCGAVALLWKPPAYSSKIITTYRTPGFWRCSGNHRPPIAKALLPIVHRFSGATVAQWRCSGNHRPPANNRKSTTAYSTPGLWCHWDAVG